MPQAIGDPCGLERLAPALRQSVGSLDDKVENPSDAFAAIGDRRRSVSMCDCVARVGQSDRVASGFLYEQGRHRGSCQRRYR